MRDSRPPLRELRRRLKAVLDSERYWSRGTALISLFAGTGYVLDRGQTEPKPASLLLVSGPGKGKTELLMRFHGNPNLSFQSDMTMRGFTPVLRRARAGMFTHIVAVEFQKYFLRKQSVADNCLGLLSEAMEEGVRQTSVGPRSEDFGGARMGLIGAITHGTIGRKRDYLAEMGFVSRACIVPWNPPEKEIKRILRNIRAGNRQDLVPVVLPVPEEARAIRIGSGVGNSINAYAWTRWHGDAMRPVIRFRSLTMVAALYAGRSVVSEADWAYVRSFDDFWKHIMEE